MEAAPGEREALAGVLERRRRDILDRWWARLQTDLVARIADATTLKDGLEDYLTRLCATLRGKTTIEVGAAVAWSEMSRHHAVTRIRSGFDVTQLVRELTLLRRTLSEILREERLLRDGSEVEQVDSIIDAAISAAIRSYADARDLAARRTEAEHIGFITHELRNPLNTATLSTSHLHRMGVPSAGHAEVLDLLGRSLRRLQALIDQVLLVERLEADQVESHPVDTSLGPVLEPTLGASSRAAEEKGLLLNIDVDSGLHVYLDPTLTVSAVANLLDHAVQYTDAGEVTFAVEDRTDDLAFHVRDAGGGLSESELRVIFQPFRRPTTKTGTGLRLTIARRAVEMQGGTIHAESHGETGCHFWFTLPKRRRSQERMHTWPESS